MAFLWETIPSEHWGKVTYMSKEGRRSQAYIDMRTGEGEDRHTDEYVKVEFSKSFESWVEV